MLIRFCMLPLPTPAQVVRILNDKEVLGRCLNSKSLGARKNCNLPGLWVLGVCVYMCLCCVCDGGWGSRVREAICVGERACVCGVCVWGGGGMPLDDGKGKECGWPV